MHRWFGSYLIWDRRGCGEEEEDVTCRVYVVRMGGGKERRQERGQGKSREEARTGVLWIGEGDEEDQGRSEERKRRQRKGFLT